MNRWPRRALLAPVLLSAITSSFLQPNRFDSVFLEKWVSGTGAAGPR